METQYIARCKISISNGIVVNAGEIIADLSADELERLIKCKAVTEQILKTKEPPKIEKLPKIQTAPNSKSKEK